MKKNALLLMALMLCCVNEINAQVEAGLPVPLALKSGISSKNLSKGDVIPFVVSAEVYDSSGDLVIPEGTVFVMGDNRTGSSDSRMFGCIPYEKIEGKVVFRFWPLNKMGVIKTANY